jgi:hypothetical protein
MLEIFKDWKLPEGKNIVLMGSCFSDNLKPFLEQKDFQVTSNLFGTLFHPTPIFNWLKYACANHIAEDDMQLVFHEEIWKSLGGGKALRIHSKEELKELIQHKLNVLHEALKSADALVITLGTAHAWIHEEFGLVGNCQRLSQQKFKQELISLNDMIHVGKETIDLLQQFNPDLKIVLTVSPVKHWRMGVVENARSKARCIELAHELCEMTGSIYFPSYEFVSDILRNDAYFESDRCHPNQRAIELVAEKFIG